MTPEGTIELLRGIQNKKVDYAEMVCAPAFAYGYEYVYPEPEDYAIEEAIKALNEIQQYREIGTVKECREAVEKQTPKKCIKDSCPDHTHYKCPSCGKIQKTKYDDSTFGCILNNCSNCGQALINEDLEGMEDERD